MGWLKRFQKETIILFGRAPCCPLGLLDRYQAGRCSGPSNSSLGFGWTTQPQDFGCNHLEPKVDGFSCPTVYLLLHSCHRHCHQNVHSELSWEFVIVLTLVPFCRLVPPWKGDTKPDPFQRTPPPPQSGPRGPFWQHMAVGQNQWYHFGIDAPPILEPILVGIGMFTGATGC